MASKLLLLFFSLFLVLIAANEIPALPRGVVEEINFQQLQDDCSTLFANFSTSKDYACSSSLNPRFLFELLGDDRLPLVSRFISLLTNIPGQTGDKDNILYISLQLLYNQTITNPPQYVSHGTDHSVRVMNWCIDLYKIPEIVSGLQTNYGLTTTNAQFVLGFMGLMHDIGYADLDKHNVPKWLHAISSGIMVTNLLTTWTNNAGQNLLNSLATSGNLVQDFIDAIGQHNWDESFCKWTVGNDQYWDQCTFNTSGNPADPSSPTTNFLNSNKTWVRHYSQGHALETPLKFSVRVADNLDAVRSRLTPVQNDDRMMRYFYRIYVDEPLRQAVANNDPNIDQFRADARQRAQVYSGLTNANQSQIDVMKKANEQSFLHFFSNYVIQSSNIDSDLWSIQVNLFPLQGDLNFQNHAGAGLYQINRLATSALSCFIQGNSTFLDLVRFSFNIPLPGLDGNTYIPLRGFTKKPLYETDGPVVYPDGDSGSICDPFCSSITVALTMSSEDCLLPSGVAADKTTCANINAKFQLVPPFTDLTYPPAPPTPSGSNNKRDKSLTIALIVLGIFAGALCVLNIAFILKFAIPKRPRSGYQTLQD